MAPRTTDRLPSDLARVRIEVPRGSLVKWDSQGGIDFLSPVPCPFNYGSIADSLAPDGDPVDALVLGGRLRRGRTVACRPVGWIRFVDDGTVDDKCICLPPGRDAAPTRGELRALRAFFQVYALVKTARHHLDGARGPTRLLDIDLSAPD